MPVRVGYLTIYSSDGTEVLASGIGLDYTFDLKSDGLYHSGSTMPEWTAPDGFLGFANSPNSSEIAYAVGDENFTFGDGLIDMDVCIVVDTSPTTTYSIIYVTNGGTLESGFDNPATATNLPSPLPTCVKANYTFMGWYYDTLYTNQATGNDTLTQDTILYAKFIYDNTKVINTKPKIYGYCPAGCRWETVHKDDINVLYDLVEIKQISAVDGVYIMGHVNSEYKMYPLNQTSDNWGISLKLKYSISGLVQEIDINPSISHVWTTLDGAYDLAVIPVDGDHLKYKVVSWKIFYHSDVTNTMFIQFHIQYRTLNTEWQDDYIAVDIGSGIPEEQIKYHGMYASGLYKAEEVTTPEIDRLKNKVATNEVNIANNEASITSLRNDFDTLEPNVNKYTNIEGSKLVTYEINGTIGDPTKTSTTQDDMPSGRYEFIVTVDGDDLRFVGDIDNTLDKINVLEAEQKTSTAADSYYFIRTHYLFVTFTSGSTSGSPIVAAFYMGYIQNACTGSAITTTWKLESGVIKKVSVVTR